MRVLVTGGAGFIGSHLCERLLAQGEEVTCLDNLSTGRAENVAPFRDHPRFKTEFWDVEDVADGRNVDRIFNLACPASPVHYQRRPVETIRTCVLGALSVLQLAQSTGARVLQASTSEVYGDATVTPQHERYWGNVNPVGPRSCYDEGKRCAESLFTSYRRHRGVDARIVRIFNTYGPRMAVDDGRVVSNFIVQRLRGEPLTIYGDGKQTRSLCYVYDMVTGLIDAMNSNGWFDGGPMNLGNEHEVTIDHLAHLIAPDGPFSYEPLPEDDPRRRCPDTTMAKRFLGWVPHVPLAAGLQETIAYFEHQQKEGRL